MNAYKEKFSELTSDYLLQKRALGDELSDEAHKAIEEIFNERGEKLPPRPRRPIMISDLQAPITKAEKSNRSAALIAFALLSAAIGKVFAHTWAGILVMVCIGVYAFFEWLKRSSLTLDEKSVEENESKAEEQGLSQLMVSAADGDDARVKELVAFGADINACTISGTTALMYAVRNNHMSTTQFLLSSGADVNAISTKGSTAIAIARKFSHVELAGYLEEHGAR